MRPDAAAVRESAPAKINLALHVTGRRPDGYHLLDSLVVFADVGDTVTARPAASLALAIEGPMAEGLSASDNLVLRAARALAEAGGGGRGAALLLEKRLPVASGIGGGSADAAATLRALDRLWGLGFGTDRLAAIGLAIGADVPVCLHAGGARMRGVGERIEPLALPPVSLLLVNPSTAVSTAAVFAGLRRRDNPGLPELPALSDARALAGYLRTCRNDLESPAIAAERSIAQVLEAIGGEPGCLLARMSGSGATCFGVFQSAGAGEAARRRLAEKHPGWWVAACAAR